MSALSDMHAAAAAIDSALRSNAADVADVRAVSRDVYTQLTALSSTFISLRAEIRSTLDTFLVKQAERDESHARREEQILSMLSKIHQQLGTNGSGGDHG